MEGVAAIVGFFGTLALLLHWIFKVILRWREMGQQAKIMTKLVERIESGGEASQLLESAASLSLFEQHLGDQRTLALQRVLRAVQSGIVLVVLSGAFFIVRTQFAGETARTLMVLATLSLAVGVGFLLASGASFALSRRWHLLDEN